MESHDNLHDMNIPVLATIGVIGVILIYVTIVATQAWFYYEFNREYEKKVLQQPNVELNHLRSTQTARITQGGVMPLDQAMQLVIERYQPPE